MPVTIFVKVTTYPFDKRFINFEDPKVLKMMTGKDILKNWQDAFGFNFASKEGDSSEVGFLSFCIKVYLYTQSRIKGLFKSFHR